MSNSERTPRREFDLELEDLLHPAQAFEHPGEVVNDPDLTLNEKRAILASWASDACAVEAAPALRSAPGSQVVVTVDDILEALRSLDRQAQDQASGAGSWFRRQRRRNVMERKRRRSGDDDPSHGAVH